MKLPVSNWKNKAGTGTRTCICGSWKQHWLNFSNKPWPAACSVKGCDNAPTLGAHIYNPDVSGEYIVPMCPECNKLTSSFSLKGVTCVSANKSKTCEKN